MKLKKGYTGRNCTAGWTIACYYSIFEKNCHLFKNKSKQIFRDYKGIWRLFLRNRYRKRCRNEVCRKLMLFWRSKAKIGEKMKGEGTKKPHIDMQLYTWQF